VGGPLATCGGAEAFGLARARTEARELAEKQKADQMKGKGTE